MKAELEVAHLHEKLDRLTASLLSRLKAIDRTVSSKTAAEDARAAQKTAETAGSKKP